MSAAMDQKVLRTPHSFERLFRMVRGSTTGSLWNAMPELTGAFPLASVLLSHMSWPRHRRHTHAWSAIHGCHRRRLRGHFRWQKRTKVMGAGPNRDANRQLGFLWDRR